MIDNGDAVAATSKFQLANDLAEQGGAFKGRLNAMRGLCECYLSRNENTQATESLAACKKIALTWGDHSLVEWVDEKIELIAE